MTIQDAKQYLKNHKEELLTGGVSGAKVYDICGEYVLKCVSRADLEDAGQYDAYRREASWYKCTNSRKGELRLNYLPEILDTYSTDEETAVLMKRYRTIPQKFDTELLKKIMEALAAVHTTCIPAFLNVKGAEEKQKDFESYPFHTAVCVRKRSQHDRKCDKKEGSRHGKNSSSGFGYDQSNCCGRSGRASCFGGKRTGGERD